MSGIRHWVDAWEGSLRGTLEVGRQLDQQAWDLPTECPGWTVKDQVSHLVGIERELAGEDAPEEVTPPGAHVRNDFGRHLERAIALRRARPGPEVLAELAAALETRLAQLHDWPEDPEAVASMLMGREASAQTLLRRRVFDVWTHEQDLRRAVGVPGGLDSAAAREVQHSIVESLPYVVGKGAAAQPGDSVRFVVGPPLPLDTCVEVDPGGRARAVPVCPDPTATLHFGWETLARLAAGRVEPAAADVRLDGDNGLAGRVLGALTLTS